NQPDVPNRSDDRARRPFLPGLAPLLVKQQGLAVEVVIDIDWVVEQKARRAGSDEVLRKKFVHHQAIPGTRAHHDRQIGLGRMSLRGGKSRFDSYVGLFARLRKRG